MVAKVSKDRSDRMYSGRTCHVGGMDCKARVLRRAQRLPPSISDSGACLNRGQGTKAYQPTRLHCIVGDDPGKPLVKRESGPPDLEKCRFRQEPRRGHETQQRLVEPRAPEDRTRRFESPREVFAARQQKLALSAGEAVRERPAPWVAYSAFHAMREAVHGQAGPGIRKLPKPVARGSVPTQRHAALVLWNDQQRQRLHWHPFGFHQRNCVPARFQRQGRNVVARPSKRMGLWLCISRFSDWKLCRSML